jgi:hypothetical protein
MLAFELLSASGMELALRPHRQHSLRNLTKRRSWKGEANLQPESDEESLRKVSRSETERKINEKK